MKEPIKISLPQSPASEPPQKESFDQWCLVELMGHQRIVGKVTEVPTQHSPGAAQPIIVGQLSKSPDPDEHMRERLKNILEDQKDRATD